MAIVITEFGKDYISEKKLFRAVSDDVLAVSVRLQILRGAALVTELTHSPELGTSDTFDFEVNNIIRQLYESQFFDLSASTIILEPTPVVTLEFTELDVNGNDLASSGSTFYLADNITVGNFLRNTFDLTDYTLGDSGSVTSLFKTSSPRTLELKEGGSHFLGINKFSNSGAVGEIANQEVVIESYDSSDVLTSTSIVDLEVQSISGSRFPVHNVVRVTMEAGVSYKLVYVRDVLTPFTTRSEVFRLNNATSCASHRIHWVNEFGVQDSYYFSGEVLQTINTDSSTYTKSTPVNPASDDYGLRVFDNEITDSWVLFTDTISQSTVSWLKNMYVSKKIAVEIDGFYYPAVLNSNKLTYHKDINGVYQINISITFSNKQLGNN